jgi:peroxiredoxin (alkyl hydroperoxide reductase subunit C)
MAILVQRRFPDFTSAAVLPDGSIDNAFNLANHIRGKIGVLVFYPLDFTFVCPTELIALDHRIEALHERGVAVVGVSIDSEFTHLAWRNTPIEKGGIGPVRYPLVADVKHEICRAYGVEADDGTAFRGTFVIDVEGIVRAQHLNDHPIGRNMDELIRLVDAVRFHAEHGEVCPAGWERGADAMSATPEGVAAYLSKKSADL